MSAHAEAALTYAVTRLSKDLRAAAETLSDAEARFLVDAYYIIQEDRKRSANQARDLVKAEEPHVILQWFLKQNQTLEGQLRAALDRYSDSHPVGRWAKTIIGIGPVISAGLLAHIDITRAPTVGHIWRFAGLDPTNEWVKGKKRPWNAELKVLCWKIGESFVKVSGKPDSLYGRLYTDRKQLEQQRNEAGEFADQAARMLETKNFRKTTDAYKAYSSGRLPPAHVHARAKRYAVKIFLSHWHHVAYRNHYGTEPPKPYVIKHLGHAHEIAPPE